MKKKEFHNRLKELRVARRLTQKETAKLVGVQQSTYRQWEYGQAITGEPYPQLAKAFNISLDTLFNIETNEKKSREGFRFNCLNCTKYKVQALKRDVFNRSLDLNLILVGIHVQSRIVITFLKS